MEEQLINTDQMAEILQVSGRQAALLIAKRERLESVRDGIAHLFRLADVEALASKRGGKIGPGRPRKDPSLNPAKNYSRN